MSRIKIDGLEEYGCVREAFDRVDIILDEALQDSVEYFELNELFDLLSSDAAGLELLKEEVGIEKYFSVVSGLAGICSNQEIGKLQDRYVFSEIVLGSKRCNLSWLPHLLGRGEKHTFDGWVQNAPAYDSFLPDLRMYFQTFKRLYNNRNHKVPIIRNIVYQTRSFFRAYLGDGPLMTGTEYKHTFDGSKPKIRHSNRFSFQQQVDSLFEIDMNRTWYEGIRYFHMQHDNHIKDFIGSTLHGGTFEIFKWMFDKDLCYPLVSSLKKPDSDFFPIVLRMREKDVCMEIVSHNYECHALGVGYELGECGGAQW